MTGRGGEGAHSVAKRGLGRGLGALLQETGAEAERAVRPADAGAAPAQTSQVAQVPVTAICRNRLQPREDFDSASLEELAASIREKGILQPLLVRPASGQAGLYELIAGERRWRAAQLAGLETVPVLVRVDLSDTEALEMALVENLQRRDLNAIEEAQAYSRLIEEYGLTQAAVADRVGRNRVGVAQSLRLLKLPARLQDWLADGSLSVGHAKALLGLSDAASQERLARAARERGWSVRQTEEAVRRAAAADGAGGSGASGSDEENAMDPRMGWIVDGLQRRFGTRVGLRGTQSRGRIEVIYSSAEELDRLLELWGLRDEL